MMFLPITGLYEVSLYTSNNAVDLGFLGSVSALHLTSCAALHTLLNLFVPPASSSVKWGWTYLADYFL